MKPNDEMEAIGIERARQRAEQADLRIILLDDRDAMPVFLPQEDDITVLVSKADLQPG